MDYYKMSRIDLWLVAIGVVVLVIVFGLGAMYD